MLSRAVLILLLQLGTSMLLCSLLSLLLKHSTAFILRHSSRMLLAACFSHLHKAEQRVLGAMQGSFIPHFRPAFLQKPFLSHPTTLHS